MKKYLAILLPAFLFIMSCTKSDTKEQCAKGTINIDNQSIYPFTLTVDDRDAIDVAAKGGTQQELFTGKYFVHIEQKEGFAVRPNVQEYYVDVKGCETVYLTIPKTGMGDDK